MVRDPGLLRCRTKTLHQVRAEESPVSLGGGRLPARILLPVPACVLQSVHDRDFDSLGVEAGGSVRLRAGEDPLSACAGTHAGS